MDEGGRFTAPISVAIDVRACVTGGGITGLPAQLRPAVLFGSNFSNDG